MQPRRNSNNGRTIQLSHQLINTLVELEIAAARAFWNAEDRDAWRNDVLRQRETRELISLKQLLKLSNLKQKPETQYQILLTWDQDLLRCLSGTVIPEHYPQLTFRDTLSHLRNADSKSIAPLFLRPGFWMCESWLEEENDLRECLSLAHEKGVMILRCGFLTQQADIYLTADLGFSAVQLHAHGLDLYELQMAVELARDCRLSPIVSASNEEELEQVLQTDAPHIALCYFPSGVREQSARFIQRALPQIPNNCTKILFAATEQHSEIQLISRLGFDLAVQFNPHALSESL